MLQWSELAQNKQDYFKERLLSVFERLKTAFQTFLHEWLYPVIDYQNSLIVQLYFFFLLAQSDEWFAGFTCPTSHFTYRQSLLLSPAEDLWCNVTVVATQCHWNSTLWDSYNIRSDCRINYRVISVDCITWCTKYSNIIVQLFAWYLSRRQELRPGNSRT